MPLSDQALARISARIDAGSSLSAGDKRKLLDEVRLHRAPNPPKERGLAKALRRGYLRLGASMARGGTPQQAADAVREVQEALDDYAS